MVRKETYLQILGMLFIASSFSFFLLWDMHKQLRSKNQTDVSNDFFLREINGKIDQAKEHVLAFRNIFSNIKKGLLAFHFDDATSLSFQTSLNDGIILPFGYAGYGPPTQGFSGFKSELQIPLIPKPWLPAITSALFESGLGPFITVTPAQEWLLKQLLVIKDRSTNYISTGEMMMDSTVLLARLFFTPGLDSLNKALDSISPMLSSILSTISFRGKSFINFFDSYFLLVRSALTHQFRKKMVNGKLLDNPLYVANGSPLNDAQARWLLFSLFVRSFLFYAELRFLYEKTEPGKESFRAVSERKSLTERIKQIGVYNASLPGFDDVKKFIVSETAYIFMRLQNKVYKDALAKIFDPILSLIGFSLDTFLREVAQVNPVPEPPVPSLSENELAIFSLDEFDPEGF